MTVRTLTNTSGLLGDRRGVAIEPIRRRRYVPGTLEPDGWYCLWRVYIDGRVRLTTDDETEARDYAEAMAR